MSLFLPPYMHVKGISKNLGSHQNGYHNQEYENVNYMEYFDSWLL